MAFQNESHYMASVTLFNTVDQSVPPSGDTPKLHLEVPVTCAYVKSMLLSADFSSMGYPFFVSVVRARQVVGLAVSIAWVLVQQPVGMVSGVKARRSPAGTRCSKTWSWARAPSW